MKQGTGGLRKDNINMFSSRRVKVFWILAKMAVRPSTVLKK